MQTSGSFYRDANRVPITTDGLICKKSITFAGVHGVTNDKWGDDGGALKDGVVFTVTGLVFCKCIAVCTDSLTGANSTIELGITGATAIFMPTETCTQIDVGQIWLNNAGNTDYAIIGEQQAAADNLPEYALNGNDIILSTKTDEVTGGTLDIYCIWRPISSSGDVVDAGN
jgi:hypothetical protein